MSEQSAMFKIGKRTFIVAFIILACLMLAAGVLTKVLPAGQYQRTVESGREMILEGTFSYTQNPGYPVWRWFTAPFEIFAGSNGLSVAVIVLFVFGIAGSVTVLEDSGVMAAAVSMTVGRFLSKKYVLMGILVFFFMFESSVIGTFEENIVLVPIVIAIAYSLKWDTLVGLGMSIMASCFGFSAALTNPFSLVVSQKIADLPLYSGFALRAAFFVVNYILLMVFLMGYAKKIEKNPEASPVYRLDSGLREKYTSPGTWEELEKRLSAGTVETGRLKTAVRFLGVFLLVILLAMIGLSFLSGVSDLMLPIVGVCFLTGSIGASLLSGYNIKRALKTIIKNAVGLAPGILLVLMALSVKTIIDGGGVSDTLLYYAENAIEGTSPFVGVLFIYVFVVMIEIFIGASTAKAFLIMPLLSPLCDLIGLTRQTAVLTFCFGDGLSNILLPTNPGLIVCLGLTCVPYPVWIRFSWKVQFIAALVSVAFLLGAVAFHYGPY